MFRFNDLTKNNRPIVMGILNVTPDSFSDGNEAFSLENVISKVNKIQNEGADIIDVGACSTAPMNTLASEEEELRRLKLFLKAVIKEARVPVSIDTFRPSVARLALEEGVKIINDESGSFKKEMAELTKEYNCGWIFMHTGNSDSKSQVKYPDGVTKSVLDFFNEMKREALKFGIDENVLAYDPGIGFGKTRLDDLELLRNTDALVKEYNPILIGVSRKRLIGEITGVGEAKNRVVGSATAAALCAYKGAGILRVHDVKETVEALKVVNAFKEGVL